MKIYLVGGAVRDKLLGLPVKEKDWVVVGADVKDMLNKGFRQVGKEFPVFLHPKTQEEYALARLERKTGKGYKGFSFDSSPDVSLEDDLARRDLTINAMAEDENGNIIDPFGGKEDLDKRVLRHVSSAFAEDPVRILRIGRFLARYAHLGFRIAPETTSLMQDMVAAGEVDALVAERVWKELQRALNEPHPEKFFEALHECGAHHVLFPSIPIDGEGMQALIKSGQQDGLIRFAILLHDQSADDIKKLSARYRVPNDYRRLALLTEKYHQQALSFSSYSAETLLALLSSLDCFRRDKRFQLFLLCCELIASTKNIPFNRNQLEAFASAAKSVNIKELTEQGLSGTALANKIKEKRIEKIKSVTP